jgi:hypothetical protein
MTGYYQVDVPFRLYKDIVRQTFNGREITTTALKIEIQKSDVAAFKRAIYDHHDALENVYHPLMRATYIPVLGDHHITDEQIGKKISEHNTFLNAWAAIGMDNVPDTEKTLYLRGKDATITRQIMRQQVQGKPLFHSFGRSKEGRLFLHYAKQHKAAAQTFVREMEQAANALPMEEAIEKFGEKRPVQANGGGTPSKKFEHWPGLDGTDLDKEQTTPRKTVFHARTTWSVPDIVTVGSRATASGASSVTEATLAQLESIQKSILEDMASVKSEVKSVQAEMTMTKKEVQTLQATVSVGFEATHGRMDQLEATQQKMTEIIKLESEANRKSRNMRFGEFSSDIAAIRDSMSAMQESQTKQMEKIDRRLSELEQANTPRKTRKTARRPKLSDQQEPMDDRDDGDDPSLEMEEERLGAERGSWAGGH